MGAMLLDMKRVTATVRLDKELLRRAGVIAAALGKTLPEYIEERLTPVVDKEMPKILKGLAEERDADED